MKKHTQSIAQGLTITGLILWIMLLFSSCTTQRHSNYQDHLKSTHNNNFVTRDNGGCGWNN
jgi:hypothetical protein